MYKPDSEIFDVKALNDMEKIDYRLIGKQYKMLELPEFGELGTDDEIMQAVAYLGPASKEYLAKILTAYMYNETDKSFIDLADFVLKKKEDEAVNPQPEQADTSINEDNANTETPDETETSENEDTDNPEIPEETDFLIPPMSQEELESLYDDPFGIIADNAKKQARKDILKSGKAFASLTN